MDTRLHPDRLADEQKRYTEWCKKLGLHEETDSPCECEGFVSNHEEPVDDLFLLRSFVHLRLMGREWDLEKALLERDEARQERDEALAQLQAIGRKSFWAARSKKQ